MAVQILMPKLGLTMKTGTVVKWLKEEGDPVKLKEPVLEIETEKLSHQIESPAEGILIKKLAVVGEKYPIAYPLGYVGKAGEQAPVVLIGTAELGAPEDQAIAPAAAGPVQAALKTLLEPEAGAPSQESGGRIFISPVARKLSAELGIDYKNIRGTGPNGRIVKADVEKYAAARSAAPGTPLIAVPEEADTVIPYAGMRRAIGENMLQAWTTIPMVTHHVMADAGALLSYRAMLNSGVEEKSGQVSVNDLMMKLTAAALAKTPIVNSSFTEQGIVLHRRVHLGMATALENGLIVPVLRDADRKNLLALSREAKDLAARARSGGLVPDDIQGATFTVSNLGGYGSVDLFTPIINPPQAAILGVGRVTDTAVPVNGEIQIRPMMGLSFTYDHRIIDGAVAAGFIKTLLRLLENPARAVLL